MPTELQQPGVFSLSYSALLIAQSSPAQPNPKERLSRIHRSRATTSAMKALTGIASRDSVYVNIEEGRGRDGYGSMGSTSRKTAPATDSGFVKCAIRRRRRLLICTMPHLPAKLTATWKTSTALIETDQCHHGGRDYAPSLIWSVWTLTDRKIR